MLGRPGYVIGEGTVLSHLRTLWALGCVVLLLTVNGCGRHKDPMGLAKLDVEAKRFDEAIDRLTSAPAEVQETYAAQLLLGEAYKGKRDYENSLKAYGKAAGLDKGKAEPYLGMAEVELFRAEQAAKEEDAAGFQRSGVDYCGRALSIDAKAAEAYSLLAKFHQRKNEVSEALESLKKAAALDPRPSRKLDVAEFYLSQLEPEAALRLAEEVLAADGTSADARIMKARALSVRDKEKAKEELRTVLSDKSLAAGQQAAALRALAYMAMETGDVKEVEELLKQMEKLPELGGTVAHLTGLLAIRAGDWSKAYQSFKRIEGSGDASVLWYLAQCEQRPELNMPNQAISHFQAVVQKSPRNVEARLALAALLLNEARNYEESMKHCGAALRERPDDVRALLLKAKIHRMASGRLHNPELAQATYGKVLGSGAETPQVLLEVAEFCIEMNRMEQALAYAKKAQSQEDTAAARAVLGRVGLVRAGQAGAGTAEGKKYLAEAVEDLRKAVELNPESLQAVSLLVAAYATDKRLEEAADLLNRFIGKKPTEGQAYRLLASVYEGMKKPGEAVAVLERAEKVPGIERLDRSLLGRAYFLAGNRKAAIETWERLIAGDPNLRGNFGITVGLGVALALDGQFSKAMNQAQAAAQQDPGTSAGLVAACVAIQAGDLGKAKEFLKDEKRPYASAKEKETYLQFVELCGKAGERGKRAAARISEAILDTEYQNTDSAVANLAEATQLLPDSIVPHYVMIPALIRAGRLKEAKDVFQRMFASFPAQGYPHLTFGKMVYRPGASSEARQQVELAVELDTGLADGWTMLARLLLEREEQGESQLATLESAAKCATRAVELDGGTMASLEVATSALYALTQSYRNEMAREQDPAVQKTYGERAKKSAEQVGQVLRTFREKFPASPMAAKVMVRFEMAEGNYARAASLAAELIRKSEVDDPELYVLAARAFYAKGEASDLKQAERYLGELIRRNASYIPAYRQLAQLYESERESGLAINTLRQALAMEPGNLVVVFELARLFERSGQHANAMGIYRSVLAGIPAGERSREGAGVYAAATMALANVMLGMPARDAAERETTLAEAEALLKTLMDSAEGAKPDVRVLLLLGEVKEQQGRVEEAIDLYRRCISIDAQSAAAYHKMALTYYRSGQFGKGIAVYEGIPAEAYVGAASARLALLYLAQGAPGDAGRAREIAEKVVSYLAALNPGAAGQAAVLEAHYRSILVLTLIADQKTAEARAEVQRIPRLDPAVRESYAQLVGLCSVDEAKRQALVAELGASLFYQTAQDFPRAIGAYQKALGSIPGNLMLLDRLADLYRTANDLENGAATVEKLISGIESGSGTLVQREYYQGLYTEAIDAYLRVAGRMGPEGRPAVLAKAVVLCKAGVSRWPKDSELLSRLAAGYNMDEKTQDQGIEVLKQIVQGNGAGTVPWVNAKKQLAAIYLSRKDGSAKALVLEICDEIEPYIGDDLLWLNNSAWLHAASGAGMPGLKKGLELAERAKELNPVDPRVRDTLGWIYYLSKRYGQAALELEYAAREMPNSPDVVYHLGAVQLKVDKREKGVENLQRALELHRQGQAFEDAEACKVLLEQNKGQTGAKPAGK